MRAPRRTRASANSFLHHKISGSLIGVMGLMLIVRRGCRARRGRNRRGCLSNRIWRTIRRCARLHSAHHAAAARSSIVRTAHHSPAIHAAAGDRRRLLGVGRGRGAIGGAGLCAHPAHHCMPLHGVTLHHCATRVMRAAGDKRAERERKRAAETEQFHDRVLLWEEQPSLLVLRAKSRAPSYPFSPVELHHARRAWIRASQLDLRRRPPL